MATHPSLKQDVEKELNFPPHSSRNVLESWKEIAAYFRREVRTVQLWEKRDGLPIRRQHHSKLGSVFAYREDLELWWQKRLRNAEEEQLLTTEPEIAPVAEAGVSLQPSAPAPNAAGDPSDHRRMLARHACALGNHFWYRRSRGSLLRSLQYFEDAVGLDSSCAEAHAGLANVYVSLSYNHLAPARKAASKAHAAVQTAMRLDPANLHVGNAFINVMTNCTWQWKKAQEHYLQMYEAGSVDSRTIQLQSSLLAAMGQHHEAVQLALQAHQLAPHLAQVNGQVALAFFYSGDYSTARAFIDRSLEIEPCFSMGYVTLGRIESQLGQWEGAIQAFNLAAERMSNSPLSQALLAYAYAGFRGEDRARQMLAELEMHSLDNCYPAYEIAAVYTLLNEHDLALDKLTQAFSTRDMKAIFVKHDPRFFPLRDSPGFEQLTSRFIS